MIRYAHRDPTLQYEEFLALERECFPDVVTSRMLFYRRGAGMYWTARDENGVLVGFMQARPAGENLHISNMSVAKAHRRRGIATELLRLAEDRARTLGFARLELGVLADNAAALGAYLKSGFVQSGPETRRYGFDLPLWYESRLPEAARMEGVETILFMREGKCVGDAQLNDALGCRELTLADPVRDLLGVISAVAKQMRPEAQRMYLMSCEANVIAEFEKMEFAPESVHLTLTKDLK